MLPIKKTNKQTNKPNKQTHPPSAPNTIQTLSLLLQHLEELCPKLGERVVENTVIPMLIRCLESKNPDIIKQVFAVLVPCVTARRFSFSSLKSAIVPRLIPLAFKQAPLAIKVSALVCFAKLCPFLDSETVQTHVLGGAELCLRTDPTPAAVMCCVGLCDRVAQVAPPDLVCKRVVPALSAVLCSPQLCSAQLQTVLKVLSEVIGRVAAARIQAEQKKEQMSAQHSSQPTDLSNSNPYEQSIQVSDLNDMLSREFGVAAAAGGGGAAGGVLGGTDVDEEDVFAVTGPAMGSVPAQDAWSAAAATSAPAAASAAAVGHKHGNRFSLGKHLGFGGSRSNSSNSQYGMLGGGQQDSATVGGYSAPSLLPDTSAASSSLSGFGALGALGGFDSSAGGNFSTNPQQQQQRQASASTVSASSIMSASSATSAMSAMSSAQPSPSAARPTASLSSAASLSDADFFGSMGGGAAAAAGEGGGNGFLGAPSQSVTQPQPSSDPFNFTAASSISPTPAQHYQPQQQGGGGSSGQSAFNFIAASPAPAAQATTSAFNFMAAPSPSPAAPSVGVDADPLAGLMAGFSDTGMNQTNDMFDFGLP
mmetsp:Transcript_20814/g.41242  ORF Transcript_20814/g.41242 Transcript_20814/m.41242 type:complete len:591 (-) Transcript_20814:150-1922(-)